MINRHTRAARKPCLPWVPSTDPRAWTVENLERAIRTREAIVAEALANDPEIADQTVNIISFAWPFLSMAERAHLLTLALTPEVRAACAAEARARGLQ